VNNIIGKGNSMVSSGTAFMEKIEKQYGEAVEKAYFNAVVKKFNSDVNALGGSGPAVVRYARSFLGQIPYVFGGNSLSGGIDCSGFTQQVYGHFGIHAPRTSEAQFKWVTRSGPVPGGLAFYVSPGGGPPPGHVAIVQDSSSVISQGGGLGPKIESLRFLPLMGTGVPPGGFPAAGGGGPGNGAIGPSGSTQAIAMALLRQYGWGSQWPAFNDLENREAGWRLTARNPSSGAYGLAQFINGPSEYFQYGGNPNTALGQLTAMMNYIGQRWGSPNAADAHERAFHWYGKGGPVPYAAGGLAATQAGERSKYFGLTHSIGLDLASAKAGSYTATHRTTLHNELRTLAARQASEQLAYKGAVGHPTTASIGHLGAAARAEIRTASDQALTHQHPGWARDLRMYLSRLAGATVASAGGGTGTGGGKPPVMNAAWKAKLANAEKWERAKYFGLTHSVALDLAHAPKGSYTDKNRKTITGELGTLSKRQTAEIAAYNALRAKPDSTNLGHMLNAVHAEFNTAKDIALTHQHPRWAYDLRKWLAAISTLAGVAQSAGPVPPGGPGGGGLPPGPPLPKITHVYGGDVGNWIGAFLGSVASPFGAAAGGMVFDKGGWLKPGWNATYNGTGAAEHLVPADGQNVTVHIDVSGANSDAEKFLATMIKKYVKVRGGNVQRAYGVH
jgi:hypothetical protein